MKLKNVILPLEMDTNFLDWSLSYIKISLSWFRYFLLIDINNHFCQNTNKQEFVTN